MKYGLYAMRDSATRQFLSITTDSTNDSAMRNFDFAISQTAQLRFRPSDFALYRIGTYDTLSGEIETQQPECLRLGTESEVYIDGIQNNIRPSEDSE